MPPAVQLRLVNLLGDRADPESVRPMSKLVFGPDADVPEAAEPLLRIYRDAQN